MSKNGIEKVWKTVAKNDAKMYDYFRRKGRDLLQIPDNLIISDIMIREKYTIVGRNDARKMGPKWTTP